MAHHSTGVSREEESLHCLTRWYFHHTFALSLTFIQLILDLLALLLFHISLTTFSITNATHSCLTLTLFTLLFCFLAIIFDTASRRPNGADSQQILGDGVGLSDPYHRHAHSLFRGQQGLFISPFFTSYIPAYEGASTPLWFQLTYSCIHSKT